MKIWKLNDFKKVKNLNGMIFNISILLKKLFLFLRFLLVNIMCVWKVVRENWVFLFKVMMMCFFGVGKFVLWILIICKFCFIFLRG